MTYKGVRVPSGRTPRTVAEDMGTMPAGYTGALEYSSETGTTTGVGQPMPQPYDDAAAKAAPATFPARGGVEKKSW